MEITDSFLVGLSSLIIVISGAVMCCVNYRRVCPVRREEVVVIQAPDWK